MQPFIDALRDAVAHEQWHAAIALALTMPDICGAAEDPGLGKGQARYRKWWTDWAQERFSADFGGSRGVVVFLGGGDAYALRCAYLHSGSDIVDGQKAAERVKRFRLSYGERIHLIQFNDVLQMDVGIFASDVADSVEAWLAARGDEEPVKTALAGLIVLEDGHEPMTFP